MGEGMLEEDTWHGVVQPRENVSQINKMLRKGILRSPSCWLLRPWKTPLKKQLPRKCARLFAKLRSDEPKRMFICRAAIQLTDGDLALSLAQCCVCQQGSRGSPMALEGWVSHNQIFLKLLALFSITDDSLPTTTYLLFFLKSSSLLK